MIDTRLIVNDRGYGGWIAISITRSMEAIAGSFRLLVGEVGSDIPIEREDACKVTIAGVDGTRISVIDGFVEKPSRRFDATSISVSFTGYDRAQALFANSVDLGAWTFRDQNLLAFARRLAAPFNVPVELAPDVALPPNEIRATVTPGESPFDALVREAGKVGMLLVSDGSGGVLLTRSGAVKTDDALVEGQNMLTGAIDDDGSERFRLIKVLASRPGSSTTSAESLRIKATAEDLGVKRTNRVKVIRPWSAMTSAAARTHADWQARTRAAQGEAVTATVRGWRQSSGALWDINQLVAVESPALRVSGELLISEVTYDDGDGGELATLRLVRPDAFNPDPSAKTKKNKARSK